MNWKLIFQLSIFGLAMAIATVSMISMDMEPFFWLIIFIICALVIARVCTGKYFLHGFMVSIFNSLWITGVHVLFFDDYIATHPEMLKMTADVPLHNHPRWIMLISGPVIGVISGVVMGTFAYVAHMALPKKAVKDTESKKAKA